LEFAHYRIRVLLHAGKPNWYLLATITPTLKSDDLATPHSGAELSFAIP
jgi:hypothetical protein